MLIRKKLLLYPLILLLLVACSTFDITSSEIDEVNISYFTDFGSVNDDYFFTFNNTEDINTFVTAINTAIPIDGDVDMPKGDYNIHLQFSDDQLTAFHLWISEESSIGTIIEIDDTSTAYNLTKKSAEQIRTLLPHH